MRAKASRHGRSGGQQATDREQGPRLVLAGRAASPRPRSSAASSPTTIPTNSSSTTLSSTPGSWIVNVNRGSVNTKP